MSATPITVIKLLTIILYDTISIDNTSYENGYFTAITKIMKAFSFKSLDMYDAYKEGQYKTELF